MTTVADLQPDPRNANKGTERGRHLLEKSLSDYGAGRSILLDKNGKIIAGNKTAEVAAALGLEDVVIVESDGTKLVAVQRTDIDLDTEAGRMMAYADNRVGQVDLDFDIEEIIADVNAGLPLDDFWFESEIEEMLAGMVGDEPPAPGDAEPQTNRAEELRQQWQTETGQLWRLPSRDGKGEHRLIVGDCTDRVVVERVMGGEKASLALLDPPYGMRLDADFSGMVNNLKFAQEKGVKNGRAYDNVIGDHEDYNAGLLFPIIEDIGEQVWFGANYYSSTLPDTEHSGSWLVWDKRLDESADKMFGSCFELIWLRKAHKQDIMRHKWAGIFGTELEPVRGRAHPNQKPVALYTDLIERYGGQVVFDAYGGSGNVVIACENLNRYGRAIEISPAYSAVILQRYQDAFGITPELIA